MFKTLRNAWSLPDLRKKLIFTVIILLLYSLIGVVPVPFVDSEVMSEFFGTEMQNTIFGLYNMMSGSAFSQATVLALGIQPYINASIIIQLLTVAIPALERMAKEEGEAGKKKIERITRYTTVGLGMLLGFGAYTIISNAEFMNPNTGAVETVMRQTGPLQAIVVILTFTAGSCIVMWMGEQINEHGIGNGISVILFANIVGGFPSMIGYLTEDSLFKWWQAVIIAVVALLLVVFIVFVNDAERRIPIQYAKRVVGRKVYGGQSTNLPIKVSMSGVMPVIFAQSIVSVPATICTFLENAGVENATKGWFYENVFSPTGWVYIVLYGLLIFFFSWFYSTIQYDPVEISNNLKKNGGFIPGFRPGKPTADFIKKVINKILVFGAVYLTIVSLLPMIGTMIWEEMSYLAIGGTSVIIVVGVALETVKSLEAQMMMRHYKGFLD